METVNEIMSNKIYTIVYGELRWALTREAIFYWSSVGGMCIMKFISVYISLKLANININGVVGMGLICFVSFLEFFVSMTANILTGGTLPT